MRSRGYSVEEHSAVTRDGYVLRLHRMTSARRRDAQRRGSAASSPARVVYLMYGYMGTDAIWSIPPANRSLGNHQLHSFNYGLHRLTHLICIIKLNDQALQIEQSFLL